MVEIQSFEKVNKTLKVYRGYFFFKTEVSELSKSILY